MEKFVITSNGTTKWESCNAKTLTGAKRCATNEFQVSVGGVIKVGVDHGENGGIEVLATKYGYDGWNNAY